MFRLSFEEAVQKALSALDARSTEVFLPLGMDYRRVVNYRVLKRSTFIFQTPRQRKTVLRQIQRASASAQRPVGALDFSSEVSHDQSAPAGAKPEGQPVALVDAEATD